MAVLGEDVFRVQVAGVRPAVEVVGDGNSDVGASGGGGEQQDGNDEREKENGSFLSFLHF